MNKKHTLLAAAFVLLIAPFSATSATGTFTATVTAMGNYQIGDNFNFSAVPLTLSTSNEITIYNLDDFIVNEDNIKPASSLEGMGIQVGISKYKEGDGIIINVIIL